MSSVGCHRLNFAVSPSVVASLSSSDMREKSRLLSWGRLAIKVGLYDLPLPDTLSRTKVNYLISSSVGRTDSGLQWRVSLDNFLSLRRVSRMVQSASWLQ